MLLENRSLHRITGPKTKFMGASRSQISRSNLYKATPFTRRPVMKFNNPVRLSLMNNNHPLSNLNRRDHC